MFHCVLSFAESSSSRTQESPLAAKDVRTRKRKASPGKETPQKRKMLKAELCSNSEEDVSVKRAKRKVREDGEGILPKTKRKRRGFDLHLDEESASSSMDTGRGRFIM